MNDVIIIGCGPATYMAAVYTCTANLSTLVIEEATPESFRFSGHDKVAGVLDIKSPESLVDVMQRQVSKFGVQRIKSEVLEIRVKETLQIETKNGIFESKSVILDDRVVLERVFKNISIAELKKAGFFCVEKLQNHMMKLLCWWQVAVGLHLR